jgi:hypothetical protein
MRFRPTKLKKLTDHTGTLLPTIESRTRQQAQEIGDSLATVEPPTKEHRKIRKDLTGLLKRKNTKEITRGKSGTN